MESPGCSLGRKRSKTGRAGVRQEGTAKRRDGGGVQWMGRGGMA